MLFWVRSHISCCYMCILCIQHKCFIRPSHARVNKYIRDHKALNFVNFLSTAIINPRRACAERVTVVVLCVCLSVSDYSRTTGNEEAYER